MAKTFDRVAARKAGYTDQEIDQYLAQQAPATESKVANPQSTTNNDFMSTLSSMAGGVAKNILPAAQEVMKFLAPKAYETLAPNVNVLSKTPQALQAILMPKNTPEQREEAKRLWTEYGQASDVMKQTNTPENLVKSGVELGSYTIPMGKARTGAGLVEKVLERSVLPAAAQGVMQSYANDRDLAGGATGGAIGGLVGGEVLPAFAKAVFKGLPTRLMDSVFRETIPETKAEIRKGAETLGQEALNKGEIGWSAKNIYNKATDKLMTAEKALEDLLKGNKKNISWQTVLSEANPVYQRLLDMGDTAGAEAMANRMTNIMKRSEGNLTGEAANQIKRDLYEVINDSGYTSKNPSMPKKGLKAIARGIKKAIEQVAPEAEALNKELGYQGRIRDSMTTAMTTGGRNNIFGLGAKELTSGAFAGAGALGAGPLGAILGVLAPQVLGSTAGKTVTANALNQAGNVIGSTLGSDVGRQGITKLMSLLGGQIGGGTPGQAQAEATAPQTAMPQPTAQPTMPQPTEQPILDSATQTLQEQQGKPDYDAMRKQYQKLYLMDLQATGGKNQAAIKAMEERDIPKDTTKGSVANSLDMMQKLYAPGTAKSLSLGTNTVGVPGALARIKREGQKLNDQEYVDRLQSYKTQMALVAGAINQAAGAGVLNGGEYQRLALESFPNEYTSEKVATQWFNNAREVLGNLSPDKAAQFQAIMDEMSKNGQL